MGIFSSLFHRKQQQTLDLKAAAITTTYVVRNHSAITNVYHDADGDWQFLGDEEVTEADALVLALGEIIELDPSVKEVLDMKMGCSAHRASKTDAWKINKDRQ